MNRFFTWPRVRQRGNTHTSPATTACSGVTAAALGAALLLGGTAMAADFFGGDFYDTTSGSCAAGNSGDDYIGECKTSGDASGADVQVTDGGSDEAQRV